MPRPLTILFVVSILAACSDSDRLAQAPNVLVGQGGYPDSQLPASLRKTTAQIFYLTDRQPVPTGSTYQGYSTHRSPSMAFGVKTVNIGSNLNWEQLKEVSTTKRLTQATKIEAVASNELVRFPATPLPFEATEQGFRTNRNAQAAYDRASRRFRSAVGAELSKSHQDSALVYVHGIRNDFSDGAATMVNLWHYSGRQSMPIVYTWPAGNKGLFGYLQDRDSSEFSVFHLKEFLRLIADVQTLQRIHIVAHSRGAELVASALRELVIAERAAGRNPRETLKIETLILAAPDLNLDVVRQRMIAERLAPAVGQTVVYMNPRDSALRLAQRLMGGERFGSITFSSFSERELEIFENVSNVSFVNVERVNGQVGHAYFRRNPDVMSDIVLTLRTGALPGGVERPLENVGPNFWNMHAGYPYERPENSTDRAREQ